MWERSQWTQRRLCLLLLGLAAGSLSGCQPRVQFAPPPPVTVTVSQPLSQDIAVYIEERGVTEAVETVEIRARVEGYLEEIHFQDGQEVKAGDVLFVIDRKPFEADRNNAVAALRVAQAEKADAEAKYRRALPLAEKKAISQEELVEKAAAYEVSQAVIEARQADLDRAELELSYTEVKSPIDGRVGARLIDAGNFVGRSMTNHLTTVIRYDPIYATFNISERELLGLIRRGPRSDGGGELEKEKIRFYMALEDETTFSRVGHFDYADLGVESATGTFRLRGVFPNPPPSTITPGMTVRIRVPTGVIQGALLVPEAAIGADQRGRYLLIVNAEDRVERRDVSLGRKVGSMQVVDAGLKSDDWVIVEGIQFVRQGSIVRRESRPLSPPPAEITPLDTSETEPASAETESGPGPSANSPATADQP
ncbi:MAG: efflux RND transporter periplasmic adaptor subunit [Pirellulaceae bacterium]|nr:efflux RND transporter periplasmic adaptor subunit [Pirellulaceae bacterium]